MRDFVVKIRTHTAMQFASPIVAGLPAQSEPLHNWKLKQFAEHRRDSDPNDLRNDTDPPPVVPVIPPYPDLHEEAAPRWAALSAKARANDTDLIVPAAQRARYRSRIFPFRLGLSRRLLRLRTRPLFPRRLRGQRPPAKRRLSQHHGLLPRRSSAHAAHPR